MVYSTLKFSKSDIYSYRLFIVTFNFFLRKNYHPFSYTLCVLVLWVILNLAEDLKFGESKGISDELIQLELLSSFETKSFLGCVLKWLLLPVHVLPSYLILYTSLSVRCSHSFPAFRSWSYTVHHTSCFLHYCCQ